MTDIALTAAQVAPCFNDNPEIVDVILTETVTKGQIGYQLTTGKWGVADANAAGKLQARGVFLEGGGAGQSVSVLIRGRCYGFTVSSLDGDAILYLSNTAGALADAGGGTTVQCGRVTVLSDSNLTKVVRFQFDWVRDWS